MLVYWLGQGCGNTFVVFDFLENPIALNEPLLSKIRLIITKEKVDSALLLMPSHYTDSYLIVKMLVYESDGSFSQFCGNGARVVGVYLHVKYNQFLFGLECHDGIRTLHIISAHQVAVDMLRPNFAAPNTSSVIMDDKVLLHLEHGVYSFYFERSIQFYFVEIGEPHLITFNYLCRKMLQHIGVAINTQYRSLFPEGININRVMCIDDSSIYVQTYERGVHRVTAACGSGAASSAAIAWKLQYVHMPNVSVHMPGGKVLCVINETSNEIKKIGEATLQEMKRYMH